MGALGSYEEGSLDGHLIDLSLMGKLERVAGCVVMDALVEDLMAILTLEQDVRTIGV